MNEKLLCWTKNPKHRNKDNINFGTQNQQKNRTVGWL